MPTETTAVSLLQFALMRLLVKLNAIVDYLSLEEYYVIIYLLCLFTKEFSIFLHNTFQDVKRCHTH